MKKAIARTRGMRCPDELTGTGRAAWGFLEADLRARGKDFRVDTPMLAALCFQFASAIRAERNLAAERDDRAELSEIRLDAWELFRKFAGSMKLSAATRVQLIRAVAPDVQIDLLAAGVLSESTETERGPQ